jgi:hypothetical protein
MNKKIILDTNFLLIPSQFKLDIFSEIRRIADFKYELFIIDKTIDELKEIIASKQQKQKNKLAAKIALQLIEKYKLKKIKTEEDLVDNAIISLANKKDYIIATQDKLLKSKLKKKSIPLIILRQKSYLQIIS